MKKSDMSFGELLKGFFGKKEANVPQDTTDEIDADYYRGSYNTVKPSENDAPVSVQTPTQTAAPGRSEPVSVTKADTDDFDFVDDDESREICEVKPSGVRTHTPARSDNEDNDNFVFTDDDDDDDDNDDESDDEKTAEISFIDNTTLDDLTAIADSIIDGHITVVDISETPHEDKVRIFDFISGVVYAVGGEMKKIREGTCVVVLPEGLDMDDFKAALAALKNK